MDTTVSVSVSDTNTVSDTVSVKKKTSEFCKPTLEEVKAYIQEKQLNVDGQKFFDFFDTGGWIDSRGNKVKSWKQKLITWDSHSQKKEERKPVAKIDDLQKYRGRRL